MEEGGSSFGSAKSESLSTYELLILHTAEAQEWATYLQKILKSSRKFRKSSILLYAVGPADQLHGYNFDYFQSSKCIVLLLTGAFLDILSDPELQEALQRLLHPPHRVVVLLCGVSENETLTGSFEDWPSWRKIYSEDEPALYISTILESINDSRREEAESKSEAAASEELNIKPDSSAENLIAEPQETKSEEEKETMDKEKRSTNSNNEEMCSAKRLTCLTIQPNRVLCGGQETIFIIFTHKVDDQSVPEVEFSSEGVAAKRVSATLENEYTLSVTAPDMPAGEVSLMLYTDQSCVSLTPVTYYTHMGEVTRHLENATDPIDFIYQAFNLTSNAAESLDRILTDSLKSRMPANGLQLFGIRQIEKDNMSAYQRCNEELPTLLHFAAKYGLKKLSTNLLQCPGALQAYSVMNKYGDYPNTLAEKCGFSDLRQFMDNFVETADMLKSHFEDSINTDEDGEVYELMSTTSQDIMMKYSGCTEDIYESMLGIDPECAEDLYEVMNAAEEDPNPEEAVLRKFFQGKPHTSPSQDNEEPLKTEEEEKEDQNNPGEYVEEEEDPYNLCSDDIYDIVEPNSTYISEILNRPPAPIPRPETSQPEKPMTYISRVFSERVSSQSEPVGLPGARPVSDIPMPAHDPYAGMKTPGQRQLISLQERVKVGEITVDEAVQEFKAWKFDHERRASSLRYQQENLKRLRESIARRHKQREKMGKELNYEISAPLQRNLYWGSDLQVECAMYESTPRMVAPPPPVTRPIQRGSWKTGSTSSTSSTESNRLSTHSTFSYSSGTEPEFEDTIESIPPPPRLIRPSDAVPTLPPPRIPPRVLERVPEKMLHERYITCPTRALPQRPSPRANSPPPIPRRLR
ncbi:hypothetical protein LDENG_00115140 [Lucifuga dentata]|nr:hypothetical protein LDENG_00115140 [Lucifuga dentata]